MTKIDFYILSAGEQLLLFTCRLIEKAYKQKHRIYIHAMHQKQAHDLDEMLWVYRDDSFLPHNLYGEGPNPPPPIQIGFDVTPENQRDILINLSQELPSFYKQFRRILEIVEPNEIAQAAARNRYQLYRGQQCEIKTHKLTVA